MMKPLLERLLQYTGAHFEHEEQLMQKCGYADLAPHKALHKHMRQYTLTLAGRVDRVTAKELLCLLKEWWLNHIQNEDKAYTSCLAGSP